MESDQTREKAKHLYRLCVSTNWLVATCETRWKELYKFSTYRPNLPFVCFSALRSFNLECGLW
jgi:hypothetical protein